MREKIIPISKAVQVNRASSSDQGENTLTAQSKKGENYAKDHGLKIVKSWSMFESATKNQEDDRRQFFEMVEFVKGQSIKDVIFDKVDRAVRGFKSAVIIEDLVNNHDVRFHFTRENLVIDKDSPPSEKLRFYLGTILAKYYIDNLRVEIKKGLDARREAGLWNHKAPLGYVNFRDPESKQATVLIDPAIGPAVRQVFSLYATGNYGFQELMQIINKVDGKDRSWKMLEKILANPFYYGELVVKGRNTGRGAHEPLISKDIWCACQKVRGIRAARYSKNKDATLVPKPFMGLMSCGLCNHSITGEVKFNAKRRMYIYYHCSNKMCVARTKNIRQEKIHDQLVEAFKPFKKFTPQSTDAFVKMLEEQIDHLDAYTRKQADDLYQHRSDLKREVERFRRLKEQGVVTDKEFADYLALQDESMTKLNTEIGAYNVADTNTWREGLRVIELFTKVFKFMELGDDLLGKARLAKTVLSNISVMDGKLRYDYEKPFDVLLKMTEDRIWWR